MEGALVHDLRPLPAATARGLGSTPPDAAPLLTGQPAQESRGTLQQLSPSCPRGRQGPREARC